MNKKTNVPLALLFSVLILLFLGVKLYGPPLISSLYQNQSFATLNRLTGTQPAPGVIPSLDYYVGEAEVVLLGPFKSLIAGLFFLIVSFLYLRRAPDWKFGAAVLVYFLLTRPEVLLFPPFGEGITGPFSDAVWLTQNKLNYIELLRQDTVMQGGPQIYPTALYPLFLAVLMKLIPSSTAFLIVMHTLVFAMSAAIIALLRRIMQKATGNPELALSAAVLLLSLPLYQSMSELINLEIPCLFFAMLAVHYLSEYKIGGAALSALASIFTKDPGILACGLVVLFGLKTIFIETQWKNRVGAIGWISGVLMIVAAKTVLREILLGQQTVYKNCVLCGWVHMKIAPWFWIYLIALAVFINYILHWPRKSEHPGPIRRIKQFLLTHHDALLMFTMAGAWAFMFTNFSTMAYRHQLLALPFIIFCVVYALDILVKNKTARQRLLTAFILFGFLNSHGLIYARTRQSTYYPTHLERSLEYRNYLKLEQTLAKEIEKNFSDQQIVAPFQTAQLLALPELGYVHQKLDVTVYGMRETLGLRLYRGIKFLDNPVFIGFPHQNNSFPNFSFPIDRRDVIAKKLEAGHLQVMIFYGGVGVESMWRVIEFLQKK